MTYSACCSGDIVMAIAPSSVAVNNKSFEGEKFRSLLGSSGKWGKFLRFYLSPPSYIHGFPTLPTATSVSTKASRSLREFSLKLSLPYSEMDESILLTHLCADFTLSGMTMESQEEKSYS